MKFLIYLGGMKMNNYCWKHGSFFGQTCKMCIKNNHQEIFKKIEKEYNEKFSDEEKTKFSYLWSSAKQYLLSQT